MSFGMTYDEFWHGDLGMLAVYWQKHQYETEQRNFEMWMQGRYIREAIVSAFNEKAKYPEKPHRITEMTEEEKQAENQRKVADFKAALEEISRRSDARKARKGAGGA